MRTWRLWCVLLVLGLLGPPLRAQESKDNVVIVLDSSGSMRERLGGTGMTKMEGAKAALKEVLKQVPESTQIGLLVFSASNLRNDWAYPLGPRRDAELMQAIDLPQPGHGTPLGGYIKKGADRLLEERAKQFGYGTYRLLVVTDGEATDGNLTDLYTPEVMARGITMDVIGVAMDRSHTLATKVHSYRAANDPASLKRAVAEVFAEVAARGTDTTDQDTFALIAPLPAALASAIIDTLARSGNHPIGTQPPPPPPVHAAPAPVSRAPAAPPSPVPHTTPRGGFRGWSLVAGLVVVIVVLRILGRLLKGSRR